MRWLDFTFLFFPEVKLEYVRIERIYLLPLLQGSAGTFGVLGSVDGHRCLDVSPRSPLESLKMVNSPFFSLGFDFPSFSMIPFLPKNSSGFFFPKSQLPVLLFRIDFGGTSSLSPQSRVPPHRPRYLVFFSYNRRPFRKTK